MDTAKLPAAPSRKTFHVVVAVILAVVLFVSWRAFPRAPRRIAILSGAPGESYHLQAERYARYLREHGLTAEVVETEGSLENLERLATGGAIAVPRKSGRGQPVLIPARAAVGFAQSGVEAELESDQGVEDLVSLGSVSFEPVWMFTRAPDGPAGFRDLEGRRLGLGPRGSGSWAIAEMLLADNDLEDRLEQVPFESLDTGTLAEALTSGEVDAVCLVGEATSPAIEELLGQPGLVPVSLPRTEAYVRRHRELTALTLPEGTLDLVRDIPAADLRLLATATNLVAREDLHPEVVGLLLQAGREIHRPASLLAEEGTFPSTGYTSLPLSSSAATYLADGRGLIYRLLPFWMAGLVTWLVEMLTPAATVAVFVYKILPSWRGFHFNLRRRRFFKRLVRLEKARGAGAPADEVLRDLDKLDSDSVGLKVPRGMASPYFEFRQAIHDMRDRLKG